MTENVFLFHSTLQLIIKPSKLYSDQPKKGMDDQKNPISIEIVIDLIAILKFLALLGLSNVLTVEYLENTKQS